MRNVMLLIAFLLLFTACTGEKKQSSSIFEGNWMKKEQIIEDGKDMTQYRWEIWDPFSYTFTSDGKLIVEGGSEPVEPTECQFTLIGDSTLHVYEPWRGNTIEHHYSILSVGSDTITMRLNASYILYPDSVGEASSGGIVYLERVK